MLEQSFTACIILLTATNLYGKRENAKVLLNDISCKDTCTWLHKQPPWLLQQLAVRCQWRHAEKAASHSECSCLGGDESTKVRQHHAGASWTSLASSPSENQVQADDDSLQVSTWIGAYVLGGRLSGNLCHCWQVTPTVHKDKDHAGDEAFHGRRSSHLEQFTSRPANCNSLTIDVRSTSEGPHIWLINSASKDYLWHALQIYSSSSSSPYHPFSSVSACLGGSVG